MIIYFSACGNSKQAAMMLAEKLGDARVINVARALKDKEFEYKLEDGESLGFVFPVYFWGVPSIVLDFIKDLKLIAIMVAHDEGRETKSIEEKIVLDTKNILNFKAYKL